MKIKRAAQNKPFFAFACILCGAVSAFSMPGASLWFCLFLGLSGLYYLYSKTTSAASAFACGFLFALGYFIVGLWWIGNALLVDGNDFAWVWPLSVIGLPTLLGLFTGTYLAIARMIKSPNSVLGFFTFVFFLTFSEWARGNAFTGFPWNLYGYAWADYLPMSQSFYWLGAYGVTFLSVLWGSSAGFLLIYKTPIKAKIITGGMILTSIITLYSFGYVRLQNHPTTYDKNNGVVVVQPNILQTLKWDPVAIEDNFLKTIHLSYGSSWVEAPPKNIFIVWPETAISPAVYTQTQNMDKIRQTLESYKHSNAYLVTGILRRMEDMGGETSYANSIVLLNKTLTALDVYNKHHLVPFGEYIPFQKYIPIKPVAMFKGFNGGKGVMTIEGKDIPAFSPLVCYEIIFPNQVVSTKPPRPRWIVNSTNDGWYGDSAGPQQHFAQTRLRAIEEGIPVVRSANTGVSGVIDSYGRVVAKANYFQEASLGSYLPEPIEKTPPIAPRFLPPIMAILALSLMIRKLFL